LKNPITSGIKPATFRLVAYCLNLEYYDVSVAKMAVESDTAKETVPDIKRINEIYDSLTQITAQCGVLAVMRGQVRQLTGDVGNREENKAADECEGRK
jgi:hypothetical protein